MRFRNGYITVERKTFLKHFEGDGKLWATFTYISMNVSWDGEITTYSKMGKDYEVEPGQFYTTYQDLNRWLGFNFRTIKSHLDRLKKRGLISVKILRNCMCIAILQRKSSTEYTTNEETINKQVNRVFKDTHVDLHKKQTVFDSEGTPNIFQGKKSESDIADSHKNIPPVPDNGSSNAMTPSDLMKLWNGHCGRLAKIKKLTADRHRKCKLRLKENPSRDYWLTIVQKLAKSDFALNGKWCSFNWLIKNEDNGTKAFEGNYDNKTKQSAGYHSSLEGISLTLEDFV